METGIRTGLKPTLSPAKLRRFAWILAALIALFGAVLLPWRWHVDSRNVSIGIAVVLALWGTLAPASLAPVYRGWDRLGHALGWINSRIILGLLYYVVITPTSLVMKLAGKDPMRRQYDPGMISYRVTRSDAPQRDDLERPF